MDKADFDKVYIAHFSKMKRFAKEYVFFEEDAENIVQDVFLEFWESKDVRCVPANITAFLFTVTKNKCLDHLKHATVVSNAIPNLQEEYSLALAINLEALDEFDQEYFGRDIDTLLADAIDSLPDKCREIFVKSKIEGKRHKDIAVELSISTHTIEKQMNIAYRKLRTDLKYYFSAIFFLLIL